MVKSEQRGQGCCIERNGSRKAGTRRPSDFETVRAVCLFRQRRNSVQGRRTTGYARRLFPNRDGTIFRSPHLSMVVCPSRKLPHAWPQHSPCWGHFFGHPVLARSTPAHPEPVPTGADVTLPVAPCSA